MICRLKPKVSHLWILRRNALHSKCFMSSVYPSSNILSLRQNRRDEGEILEHCLIWCTCSHTSDLSINVEWENYIHFLSKYKYLSTWCLLCWQHINFHQHFREWQYFNSRRNILKLNRHNVLKSSQSKLHFQCRRKQILKLFKLRKAWKIHVYKFQLEYLMWSCKFRIGS